MEFYLCHRLIDALQTQNTVISGARTIFNEHTKVVRRHKKKRKQKQMINLLWV